MTTAIANPVRQRIAQGGVALGVGVRVARGVEIAKLMKVAGFDWLFIDLEHGQMSIDAACQMSVAALDAGIAPLVRVPMGQLTMGTRCLDGGALGIVMPHVDTAEEARAIADAFRYPPEMQKGFQGADRWVPIDYRRDWEIVRTVAATSGQAFTRSAFEAEKARAAATAKK